MCTKLTLIDFVSRIQSDTRIVCQQFCVWCSCHNSSANLGSASRNSSWVYSCEHPNGAQLRLDRLVWIPNRRRSTRWNPDTIYQLTAPAEIARVELDLIQWNMVRLHKILHIRLVLNIKISSCGIIVKIFSYKVRDIILFLISLSLCLLIIHRDFLNTPEKRECTNLRNHLEIKKIWKFGKNYDKTSIEFE